jgi:2-dehydro-3-deoxyphosphogluconate aldolase / (4S)-4-hydroxy-2-oxoglutarate aldolase
MNSFSRLEVINTIEDQGLVPIFYHSDVDLSKKVLESCAKGNSRILEFTYWGKDAFDTFKELSLYCKKVAPDLILGVGSVFEEHTAAIFVSLGANFIVSPFLNENIAKFCNRRKVLYIPGCATVTEISKAEESGAEFVKLYPGSFLGGPNFVKTILGPMPWTRIVVTGGIDPEEGKITEWFNAGVGAVGIGSKLIKKDLYMNGDYPKISENISSLLALIHSLKTNNAKK